MHFPQFFKLTGLIFCLALLSPMMLWAQDAPIPTLNSPVMDTANLLSAQEEQALVETLNAFEAKKGAQIVVLTVPTTQPETIEQYSIRVAEAWKIGRATIDDGAILVVAANDRALRIEVGYGLEGALTDLTAKRIIDQIMVPQFRQGQFANGIAAGVAGMMQVIDGEPLPAPAFERQQRTSNPSSTIEEFAPLLFILALGVGNALRKAMGKGPAALLTGGAVGLLAWLFIGALVISALAAVVASVMVFAGAHTGRGIGAYGGRRGGFGGGGFGGGFGGGGGGFGGGGASGRW